MTAPRWKRNYCLTVPNYDGLTDQSVAGIQAAFVDIAAYYPAFWQSPVGFGGWSASGVPWQNVDALPVLWVTDPGDSGPGTYRDALAQPIDAVIRMAHTQDTVDPKRTGWLVTGNKILDGRGYPGTFYGAHQPNNLASFAAQYATTTQPFAYGQNPSGGVYQYQNVGQGYLFRCNGFGTGDVVSTHGAYYFQTNQRPGPFNFTAAYCRIGRNPDPYSLGAPITNPTKYPWATTYDAYRCSINNDAGNGKGDVSDFDHNNELQSPFPLRLQQSTTLWRCVFNMVGQRNGKARNEYVDMRECLVMKYGFPFNIAAKSGGTNYGQGSNVEDGGVMNILGCVFEPYRVGEPWGALLPSEAAAFGVPATYVSDPQAKAFALNGTAKTDANVNMQGCWTQGQSVDVAPRTTGFAVPYSLPWQDRSTFAAASDLVTMLEDSQDRAGNPCSRVQSPSWRAVNNGAVFPNPA